MLATLAALTALAFWLRHRYVQNVDMSVDEFTSLWAARRVMETGTPRMLSGAFYLRGLLLSYQIAALGEIAGLTRTVARAPSLFYGVLSVPLLFVMGWRGWNARVGLLAAVGLALLSDAIAASGKVRFYAPALFFVALAVWIHYESLQRGPKRSTAGEWACNVGYALAFACAVLSYEGGVLIYPALLLVTVWWSGWRGLRRGPVLVAQVICIAAIALRFGLEAAGAQSYLASMQESKAIFQPFAELPSRLAALGDKFAPWRRLVWTLGAGVALVAAATFLVRQRGRLASLPPFQRATVVYAVPLALVVGAQVLVIGDDYGVDRQVLIVVPFWLMIGAAGFVWVIERVTSREGMRWAMAAAVGIALGAQLWPYSLKIAEHTEEGYEPALAWLAQQVQPGDATLSPQPSACGVMLPEPCDYYMRSDDYKAYMVEQNGEMVDLWSGAPLIATAEELAQVVQSSPRTWIVIDGKRLGRRHPADFIEVVMREFDRAYSAAGVWVLKAEGWKEPRTYDVVAALPGRLRLGPLTLEAAARGEPIPGKLLPVRLLWRVDPGVEQQVNTSVQIVASDGSRLSQADGPPAEGLVETMDRPVGLIPDAKLLQLPEAMAAGRYRLEAVTYEALTGKHLAGPVPFDWFWAGPQPSPLPSPLPTADVAWDSGVRLEGAQVPEGPWQAGSPVTVKLQWIGERPIADDYVMFVQLLNADGNLMAQADREPEGGFYPTSAWRAGESVQDSYTLDLPPDMAAGEYSVITGMYRRDTEQRAAIEGDGDALTLATVEIE